MGNEKPRKRWGNADKLVRKLVFLVVFSLEKT